MDARSGSTARRMSGELRSSSAVSFRFSPARRSVPRTSPSMRRRARSPSASAERAEECRVSIAKAWLGHELAGVAIALSGASGDHPGRGRGPDLFRLPSGPGHRSAHDGRGPARSHSGVGAAARSHSHDLRELFRRTDAALGRRGSVASRAKTSVSSGGTTRSPSTCWRAAGRFPFPGCSSSRTTPRTS